MSIYKRIQISIELGHALMRIGNKLFDVENVIEMTNGKENVFSLISDPDMNPDHKEYIVWAFQDHDEWDVSIVNMMRRGFRITPPPQGKGI